MKRSIQIIVILFLACTAVPVSAQELVYGFVNPSFSGGNAFNASWLLQHAQLQNTFTASPTSPSISPFRDTDPLKDFSQSLNRQILSRLSREILGDLFGENGMREGQYTFGDYDIEISETAEGVSISIKDAGSGSETSILVPYF